MILLTFAGVAIGYLVGMYHRFLEQDYEWWEERNKHLHDCYVDPQSGEETYPGEVFTTPHLRGGY